MNTEIRKRWVAALRSGQYKQGNGKLKDQQGRFCCLGVLCDLHAQETGNKWELEFPGMRSQGVISYLGRGAYLPLEVVTWAGLKSPQPRIEELGTFTSLNDARGMSFRDIADAIESYGVDGEVLPF